MRCSPPEDCTAACTTCSSAPDMVSGFTLVRNAVRLDYPIVPAIRSILEICDEVVVNVGKSDDATRDLVAGLGDPRVRILDTVWDFSRGSSVLAQAAERALRACRRPAVAQPQAGGVQGDLHRSGGAAGAAQRGPARPRVDPLAATIRRHTPAGGPGVDRRAAPFAPGSRRGPAATPTRASAAVRVGLDRAPHR